MAKLPPDSDEQQAQVTAVQDEDGYNWGYNILIFTSKSRLSTAN